MARPTFKPTKAQRRDVMIMVAAGMSEREIAAGLGLARDTLNKYFFDEMSIGRARKRREVVVSMFRAAKKGNVAAQKAFLALGDLAPEAPPAKPEKPEKLGKKEQAARDAETAEKGTSWGDILH